ncbi:hypothetical protein [Krasilnikovia cinnamomea]|nr:hypothetical protein [Krasilnikovia cinnamomea]
MSGPRRVATADVEVVAHGGVPVDLVDQARAKVLRVCAKQPTK